jgi:hypothetical protein
VLLLDGVNDVLAAIAAFPHRDALQELFSQWRGRETAEIDFAALAEHVDAVWMTAGARHRLMLAADLELVHYTTWDIESVVWLRWRVARAVRLSKCPAEEREGGQG